MAIAAALPAICIHYLTHRRDSYCSKLHRKKLIWAEFVTLAFLVQKHQYLS